jgi:hypothetical protein
MQVRRVKRSVVRPNAALEKELAEIDAEIYASVRGSAAWTKEGPIRSGRGVDHRALLHRRIAGARRCPRGRVLGLFFETTMKN